MARITIEDCTEKVPNRFHLVQMAAIRAKQLKKGANPLVQNEENKEVVVALREIAAGLVNPDFAATQQQAEGIEEPLPEFGAEATAETPAADEAPVAEPTPEN